MWAVLERPRRDTNRGDDDQIIDQILDKAMRAIYFCASNPEIGKYKRGAKGPGNGRGFRVDVPQSSSRPSGMDSSLSAMHVLHLSFLRLCWQMPSPPQSLHRYLCRLCWQMLAPLHSLRWLLTRACWHMLAPPHSLHWLICRLCLHCLGLSPKSSCAAARFLRSIKIFWRSASTCGSIRRNRLCPREMLRVASRIHQMFPGSSTC